MGAVATLRGVAGSPRRALTDWTTVAGLDGAGLLALVTGGATAEGIHLATLGYEVFVLHVDDVAAAEAEAPPHVHHVTARADELPAEWTDRFDLVVALDGAVVTSVLAPQGLLLVVADGPVELPGLTSLIAEPIDDGQVRSVLARL